MLVRGCGVDLIENRRIAKALERKRFRDRIYTSYEQEYLQGKNVQSWAARFAAKEAVMKALGRGWLQGVPFNSIEIHANSWGQPQVRLLEPALNVADELGITAFKLSLSHTKDLAIAYVIALGEE